MNIYDEVRNTLDYCAHLKVYILFSIKILDIQQSPTHIHFLICLSTVFGMTVFPCF